MNRIASLRMTIKQKLLYVKNYALGGRIYDILHRGVNGNMDKELTKLRDLICSIFKTRTISYLDLSIFGLDPLENSIKMAITAITLGKKKGERIRDHLELSIQQMLSR